MIRDGELAWFHGHGLADVAAKAPITEDTVFRIGSITKTFTAIAVMQLWELGRRGSTPPRPARGDRAGDEVGVQQFTFG